MLVRMGPHTPEEEYEPYHSIQGRTGIRFISYMHYLDRKQTACRRLTPIVMAGIKNQSIFLTARAATAGSMV
jgi:hypothetical protein